MGIVPAVLLQAVLLAVLLAAVPGAARAEENGLTLEGGYLLHRISFDTGYGAYLKRRYGARHVDMEGVTLSGVLDWGDHRGYGGEYDYLQGGFNYVTLNGQHRRAEFVLHQLLALFRYRPPGALEFALGGGINMMIRSLEGAGDANIDAGNVENSEGTAEDTSYGLLMMGEVRYRLRVWRVDTLAGLRLTFSRHQTRSTDNRPALDGAQRPVDAYFDVGGFSFLFTLGATF